MKNEFILCRLCGSEARQLNYFRGRCYYECGTCNCVLMNPSDLPSPDEEKKRYEMHNNDVYDEGYREFVSPIVENVHNEFSSEHTGLDFGAGTGPVIAKMLEESGYNISIYDPFFHKYDDLLCSKYDYIVCCEVIEHFHYPSKEFELLSTLLNPGGVLYCMTEPLCDDIDFSKWYYKNDETHVIFYRNTTFEWIVENMDFTDVTTDNRLIRFSK